MAVARLVARHEKRARKPEAPLDEAVVRSRDREERRDRRTAVAGGGVAHADDGRALLGERRARVGDALDRAPEAFLGVEGRVDERGLERSEAGRGDEERRERDERRERPLRFDRGPRADERRHGHHGALPVVVDRGVRHLGEPLAEVGRERACTPGERRDRRVVAHRVDGVAPALRDRAEHEAQLLARVAVQRVARDELGLGRRDPVARLAEADALGHPGRVGPARRELSRELGVEAQTAPGVDREQLARPEACAPDADALGQRNGARLGGDRDEPVVADRDTERPQAVPVELRPADDAVREDEPRGPVPRLDGHGVVAAHRALLLVDARVVLPGGRHEPRERLLDVEARADEELDGVVEEGRVRAPVVECRREQRGRAREPARAPPSTRRSRRSC